MQTNTIRLGHKKRERNMKMRRMIVAEEIMVGDGTSDGVDVEW